MSRPVVAFQIERLGQFLEDAGAQLVDHWYETEYADHDNWSLDLDHSTFINLDHSGILKIITARVEDKLIGYLAFLLVNHLESKTHKISLVRQYYLDRKYRGLTFRRMVKFYEEKSKEFGAEELCFSYKIKDSRLGNLFTKYLGYQQSDIIIRKKVR